MERWKARMWEGPEESQSEVAWSEMNTFKMRMNTEKTIHLNGATLILFNLELELDPK